jgi:hypothetical protein
VAYAEDIINPLSWIMGGSMEPIGYFILGTVLAIALIGTGGFLIAKRLEQRLNSQKP